MGDRFLKSAIILNGVLASSLVFADDTVAAVASGSSHGLATGLAKLGAAIAIGLGAFGAATAQGKAAGEALAGIAKNPTSKGDVFVPLIIALAFMEFLGLLSFIVALMLVG